MILLFLCFIPFNSYSQEDEISYESYNESIRLYNESRSWLVGRINLDLVVSNCNRAILLNHNNSGFYFALSNAHSYLSKLDSAKSNILKVIELSSEQSDYYLAAAHIYFKQKDYFTAVEYYSNAISYNQNSEVPIDLPSTYYRSISPAT